MADGKIFINYRREDSGGYARSLFDRLNPRFPKQVFMDVGGSIEFGLDFAEEIQKAVSSCDALIVLIGRQWLTLKDASGRRRLDDPGDFVRVEISAALKRNVRVIPALVANASMPTEEDLPPELKPLTRRQAVLLSDQDWEHTVNRLIKTLEVALVAAARTASHKPTGPVSSRLPHTGLIVGALAALLVIVTIVYGMTHRRRPHARLAGSPALSGRVSPADHAANPPASRSEAAVPLREARTSDAFASSNKLQGGAIDPRTQPNEMGREARSTRRPQVPPSSRRGIMSILSQPRRGGAPAESFDTLVLDGDVAYQSGQYQKALDKYMKAYRIRTTDRGVRRRIATTLTLLGRPEEAQKYQ